jgi:aldehyde dehydrogenase (NAD+)
MMAAIEEAKKQGGRVLCGGKRLSGKGFEGGCYVEPTIVSAPKNMPLLQEETFAPLLYLVEVDGFEEALRYRTASPGPVLRDLHRQRSHQRGVPERRRSDCGIANVNLGTSGAEIGGAFGGEKDTGGGRESGSDAWKAYMRRQTNTINWGQDLKLAQGLRFGE